MVTQVQLRGFFFFAGAYFSLQFCVHCPFCVTAVLTLSISRPVQRYSPLDDIAAVAVVSYKKSRNKRRLVCNATRGWRIILLGVS
jgi:hypothetical protein